MRRNPGIRIDEAPGVYPPSADTHLLLAAVTVVPGERFLEVGTGAGLVGIHAGEVTRAAATDVNPSAVSLARANARTNGIPLEVVRCDLMDGVRGRFDVVAFNPPYLEGRPEDERDLAVAGGAEGSDVAVRFLRDLPRVLAPGGRAYLLLSRANGPAHRLAASAFDAEPVLGKSLFFERLEVLLLRHRLE